MNRTAYSDTQVLADRSQARIRGLLSKYGADRMRVSEDFKSGDIRISFEHHGIPIVIPLSTSTYEMALRKDQLYSSRTRRSFEQYERDIRDQAAKGIWRAAETWLKATLEAVEFGLVSFEEAFLASFGRELADGTVVRLGDRLIPMLESPDGVARVEGFLQLQGPVATEGGR